uniref:Uncharacterized protein AlNc14C1G7 n=1 Tax=Albugo laibachii Nc14 TaxID=890382 RepID=F0VYK0_9STRA|nr:conserved hypothetical protein [Albugo laibachii Nc14]|eukprot:CCA13864.1 conserved hypothetical protein [Albugo laibachii Nc14]
MSPSGKVTAAEEHRAQSEEEPGHERASSLQEEPRGTQGKLLDLLTDLTERMEASKERQEEQRRLKGHEASVFGSMLGQGRPMSREALEMTPPRLSAWMHWCSGQCRDGAGAAAGFAATLRAATDLPTTATTTYCTRTAELYQGLGRGYLSWGKRFVPQISFAERASVFQWSEDVKVDVLGHHLTGMEERYYKKQVEGWWEEEPTLEHVMQRLLQTFATMITPDQSMKLFTAPKSPKRSWTEHYLYLVALSEACGGADNLAQDNIVHYADPSMRASILSRLNLMRTDYLRQAEELAHFAQSTEFELRWKHFGRDLVNNVHEWRRDVREERKNVWEERRGFRSERRDARKCYKCGKPGHLKAACLERNRERGMSAEVDFVLTVDGPRVDEEYWILDSGWSRHLVMDDKIMEDHEEYVSVCVLRMEDTCA